MKKLALAFLVALSLGCSTVIRPAVEVLRPDYLEAVRPIQVKTEGASQEFMTYWKAQGHYVGEDFTNICTASHINREEHLWLTAAHCMVDIGPEGRYIEGAGAEVVYLNEHEDLAVFKVRDYTGGKTLQLYRSLARFNQDVIVVGHPFGIPDVIVTRGFVANPVTSSFGNLYMIYDTAGAPGNSGSPVITVEGQILSVLQIGFSMSFSPVTGGAPQVYMRSVEKYFPPVNSTVR